MRLCAKGARHGSTDHHNGEASCGGDGPARSATSDPGNDASTVRAGES